MIDTGFRLIAITLPGYREYESREIVTLLDSGFERVHIRKPEWSNSEVLGLLNEIPREYHERLTLHQTPEIFGSLKGPERPGFQLNGRHPVAPEEAGLLSVSCHSLEEATKASENPNIGYQTLSPIFDSISKNGYRSRFRIEDMKDIPRRTIALGGITPYKIPSLIKAGFDGAAFLGFIWDRIDRDGDFSFVDELISRLKG